LASGVHKPTWVPQKALALKKETSLESAGKILEKNKFLHNVLLKPLTGEGLYILYNLGTKQRRYCYF
jgi:hypothetical protein